MGVLTRREEGGGAEGVPKQRPSCDWVPWEAGFLRGLLIWQLQDVRLSGQTGGEEGRWTQLLGQPRARRLEGSIPDDRMLLRPGLGPGPGKTGLDLSRQETPR